MKKVIIDTNIWVYAFDSDNIYHQQAFHILQNTEYELYITPKQISEFIAVLSKKNVPYDDILGFVKNDMLENSILIYPNQNSISQFVEICGNYSPRGNRVFDMEIVSIAKSHGISEIATINIKDFENISDINIVEK
jgi:predicted nucleic acid-binding protein